jgi:diguanylate cyclase (GGDEF)-like protein
MTVDVDHFKNFNDSYGHEAGDELLKGLASVFRTYFRAEDMACRHGGEEFALILPDAARGAALNRAEELKSMASSLQVERNGHRLPHVTISIGIACYPQRTSAVNELIQLADKALYQAKEQGRDRVVTASLSVPA